MRCEKIPTERRAKDMNLPEFHMERCKKHMNRAEIHLKPDKKCEPGRRTP